MEYSLLGLEKFVESTSGSYFMQSKRLYSYSDLYDESSNIINSDIDYIYSRTFISEDSKKSKDIPHEIDNKNILLSEGNYIISWKLVENISSRLLEFNEETVILECLIDKEKLIYEEREFSIDEFSNFELYIGKLFKICFYRRVNQLLMEVKEDNGLVSADDFPRTKFVEKYSNIKLRK